MLEDYATAIRILLTIVGLSAFTSGWLFGGTVPNTAWLVGASAFIPLTAIAVGFVFVSWWRFGGRSK